MNWVALVLAAGIAGAVAAWPVFKWLAERWIEQRFSAQLERLKHEQNKEIEAVRQRIQSQFSRISKIHEKEFEVLPKAWFLLHDAYGKAFHAMKALKEVPDFLAMPDDRFEEFLEKSPLLESHKNELRKRPRASRHKYWSDQMFWIESNRAAEAHADFHNYLIEYRIFMTDGLREKFGAVDNDLDEALIEHDSWKQFGDPEFRQAVGHKLAKLPDKIAAIEAAVQKRLRYEDA